MSNLGCPYAEPILFILSITSDGIGKCVQFHLVIFLPVRRFWDLYPPYRLPVGPRVIAPTVLAVGEFVGLGLSCTWAYDPYGKRQYLL